MNASPAAAPRVLLACDFQLRYAARLAAALARAGAAAALLSRDHELEFGGVPGAAARFLDVTLEGRVPHRALPGRVRSPAGWLEAMRLRRRLRGFGAELVHIQESIGNDPRLLLAAGLRPRRYAFTVHDPVRHPGDHDSARIAWSNRTLARGAGLIFVHGEALREELVALARPRAPIVVVPHGIAAAPPSPPPATPAVLAFGRLSHYKGIDVLLDAMPAVWRQLPAATLTIAGEGELADHPALADPRVTVRLGYVAEEDVPGLITAASCVALPYRQASQSGVGSLVKPYERPLVVTAVGGLPELVADGSGLVVPPEDPRALAAALVEVLSDRDRAAGLAARGRATAAGEGSWEAVAELTLAAYREHLGVGWR